MKNQKFIFQAILIIITFILGIITTYTTKSLGHIFYIELSFLPSIIAIVLLIRILLRTKKGKSITKTQKSLKTAIITWIAVCFYFLLENFIYEYWVFFEETYPIHTKLIISIKMFLTDFMHFTTTNWLYLIVICFLCLSMESTRNKIIYDEKH